MSVPDPSELEVWWTDLPVGAEGPVKVFVNGREMSEGQGLRLEGNRIHFDEPLRARPDMGFWRGFMLAAGIGVYGDLKGDSIDIQYMRDGIMRYVSDRKVKATGPRPG